MNTAFILLSIIINKFDLELKILNSIFKFNLKKKKIILKLNKLNDFEDSHSTNLPSPVINFKKMTNIIHHLDLLDNKSKNSLIKESEMNNISLLKLSENKNELENKNKNTIVKRVKRKSNALSVDNSKIELSKDKMSKKKDKNVYEYNKENGTINLLNVKKNNIFKEFSYKDFNDTIELNMFDYCCCYLTPKNRHKIIKLYNIANSFYRKKLDVVNVFNLLLLIEKKLLKKNSEFVYSFNEELDNTFSPKK